MRGHHLLAAAIFLTAALGAQPAAAQSSYHDEHVAQQQQCQRQKQGATAAGAIMGGILGAVLGSQAAARGHRTDGSVLGGVLGAAAGAAVGNSSARCDARVQGEYDPYYGQPQPGPYGQEPYGEDYGLEGGPYGPSDYIYNAPRRRGGDCRWGEIVTRDPDGYEYRENVYMCRGRDGVWRRQ